MKIALINPPDENRVFTEVPSKVNLKSGILPPMGLLYLESYLHKYSTHQVKLMDCLGENINYEELKKKLIDFNPEVIGVTGHTHNIMDMIQTSTMFKKINPEGQVIWGGPHASAFPVQSMSFSQVDYVVCGEGEKTLHRLLEHLDKSKELPDHIRGMLYRKEGEIIQTDSADYIMDLDELPHPRRNLLNIKNYYYTVGSGLTSSGFVSSRGCPYHCTFCSTPGKVFRCRSAEDVVNEMEECQNLGIKELYFVDDTFNVNQERVLKICKKILERKLSVSWNYRGRINLITQEQLEMAENAGCTRIQLGVETGTDEGLKKLKKGLTTNEIRKVFKWIKQTKISSAAYFMLGCPHETCKEEVYKTIDFAIELDPDYVLFGILTPYPDTEIYREGIEKGIIDPSLWEKFVTSPDASFMPQLWTEYFTLEEMQKFLDTAYKRFYRRPGYMLKRLSEIKSPQELWRKMMAGLQIIR